MGWNAFSNHFKLKINFHMTGLIGHQDTWQLISEPSQNSHKKEMLSS